MKTLNAKQLKTVGRLINNLVNVGSDLREVAYELKTDAETYKDTGCDVAGVLLDEGEIRSAIEALDRAKHLLLTVDNRQH